MIFEFFVEDFQSLLIDEIIRSDCKAAAPWSGNRVVRDSILYLFFAGSLFEKVGFGLALARPFLWDRGLDLRGMFYAPFRAVY